MRLLCANDVFGLWPFLALHDFKLHIVPFVQAFVAFRRDRAVMDKHVRTIIPSNKAESFGVIEPLYFSFDS